MAKRNSLEYVLITPTRNEAAFIEMTIQSVISQTVIPVKWIIVSDGSTDGTDDIVKHYMMQYEWIELVQMPPRQERHFAGKAYAFNRGYGVIKDLSYDIIGNLDSDVSFEPDFFEFLLIKFFNNPKLGIAGTRFIENGIQTYDYHFSSIEHVSGQCQLFRRECFEEIGGYIPVKGGGIDVIAVLTARMNGWLTRAYTEKHFLHHRTMGTEGQNRWVAKFRDGKKDYTLGSHPLWEICRVTYQATRRPYILGALVLFLGYSWCAICRMERPISKELIKFRRKDQMHRLRKFFANIFIFNIRK